MIEQRFFTYMNLVFLQECRHRNDDGEFLRIAFVIISHRHHGLVFTADQGYLGGLVEQLCIGLADVKAAESVDELRRTQQAEQCKRIKQVSVHKHFLS